MKLVHESILEHEKYFLADSKIGVNETFTI